MNTAIAHAPSYLATAFYSQYNLILLGGSALFSLASASPVPLLFGLAAEACWLGVGPKLPVFRRNVDSVVEAERRQQLDDELMAAMRSLDAPHMSRLLAVGQAVSLFIVRASQGRTPEPELALALVELEHVRPGFLKLCQLQERLAQYLDELAQRPPEHEVAKLSQAYAAEKDLGARLTLHQSIKLLQRKIEQKARMIDIGRSIDLKLSLIEQSLAHLRQQQEMGAPGAVLMRDVRGLLAQIGSVAGFETELGEAAGVASVPPPSASPAV